MESNLNINCVTKLLHDDNKLSKRGIIAALYEYPEYRGCTWRSFLRACSRLTKAELRLYLHSVRVACGPAPACFEASKESK